MDLKQGDPVNEAISVIRQAKQLDMTNPLWPHQLIGIKLTKTDALALANNIARIARVLLMGVGTYRKPAY